MTRQLSSIFFCNKRRRYKTAGNDTQRGHRCMHYVSSHFSKERLKESLKERESLSDDDKQRGKMPLLSMLMMMTAIEQSTLRDILAKKKSILIIIIFPCRSQLNCWHHHHHHLRAFTCGHKKIVGVFLLTFFIHQSTI